MSTIIRVKTADQEKEVYYPANKTNLYIATAIVNMAGIVMGSMYGWSSPSLAKLQSADSWLPVDTDQASWIGSLISLGSLVGPLLGGWLLDHVGRRPTVVIAVATAFLSMAILYQASAVWEIYVARVVAGVAGGIVFSAVPLYVGEIAEDSVRSALASLFNFGLVCGMLLVYSVGPYVSYWSLLLVTGIAPVLFFLASPCLPESPHFHLAKGLENKAFNNLTWLRKGVPKEQVVDEINEIKDTIQEASKNKARLSDLWNSQSSRRALLVTNGCMMFQQLSGINVIFFYSENIFKMAGQNSLSPSESVIMLGVVLLLSAIAAVPLAQRNGIKIMLLISAFGMFLFLGLLSLYFFLQSDGRDMSSYGWLPLVSLIGFAILFTIGFGPHPWALTGEMFPPNIKGLASAFTTCFCWTLSFILTKLFPILVEVVGTYPIFLFFSVSSAVGFFFTVYFVPDTRDMSLQGIQELLNEPPEVYSKRSSTIRRTSGSTLRQSSSSTLRQGSGSTLVSTSLRSTSGNAIK